MSQTENAGRLVGYARAVPSDTSALNHQIGALNAHGCELIFADLDFRLAYREQDAMFNSLRAGDIVVVASLDRMAGSLLELLFTLNRIRGMNCQFCSLAEPWANSASDSGTLTLSILTALANLDRNFKRIAAEQGRIEAKAKGIHIGRLPKLSAQQQQEAITRLEAGDRVTEIAKDYRVSVTTIKRLKRQG
jgi:DNA invertase Pin-like site-specific DNA recombinase